MFNGCLVDELRYLFSGRESLIHWGWLIILENLKFMENCIENTIFPESFKMVIDQL